MPRKQTPWQPTPGPSGTQWLKYLSHEPEVALTQSTEEPFARPATPCSIIIINNMPVGSPPSHSSSPRVTPPSTPIPVPPRTPPPSPLTPTITLARNLPTYDQL
ncbi:hypothetical protein O181_108143 [Austropuccinia psidii MF-1]|uniref:Uncharacterized protein n=1 Tax=Austropuccinia psidii MF-1 TaxID=1389203 RepID=A0A9Q3PNK1_9BASI|nr:hypothetical protein [Austropuccinia psidii MF-1]